MNTKKSDREVFAKTSMSLSPYLLTRVDEYATKLGISRSAAISVLIHEGFKFEDQMKEISDFNVNFKEFMEEMKESLGGLISEDD